MGNNTTPTTPQSATYSKGNNGTPIKKYTRLKTKLIISIVISIVITFMVIFAILAGTSYNAVKKSTLESTQVLSEKYAGTATDTLERALEISHTIRSAIGSLQVVEPQARRKVLHDIIQNCFKNNSGFFSMWACYEPNQFDGLDAEYAGTTLHDETGRVIMGYEERWYPRTKRQAI